MKPPILHRRGIPFFYEKTKAEYHKDPYERYDEMVVKQSVIHLADTVWKGYPMQAIFDFAENHYPTDSKSKNNILELGCGVGRWIGTLAQGYPNANCWGIDYSYQMLRRASEFWMEGREILMDLTRRGFTQPLTVQGHQLKNLQLGLAKAENLPFASNTQDLVLNSFLLDRLDDPSKGLQEMHRVLKPNGKLVLVTPLNFHKASHWQTYYPPIKLSLILTQIGFSILDWQEEIIIKEPMDFHGNAVTWRCIGFVAIKMG
ncbi:MAG: methyltransferase domain-containing protein [Chitinophagales bacterium]